MDTTILQDYGLTEAEAKVYLALLELGSTTTGDIISKTHLHKATVYLTLDKLQQIGLVSYIIKDRARHFQAVSPQILLERFKDRVASFESFLPNLLQREKPSSKTKAEIFVGKKAVISIYRDILKYKEYCTFGAGIPIIEILGPFYYQFQKMKRSLGIRARILVSEKVRNTKTQRMIYGEYKFLPRAFEGPANTLIYGNKLAIIIWTEEPTAFVLESKEATEVYKKYFEVLWKSATS